MDFLEGIDLGTLATLITVGLTVLSALFGEKYAKYKRKCRMFVNMIDDDKVTKEEMKNFSKNDPDK